MTNSKATNSWTKQKRIRTNTRKYSRFFGTGVKRRGNATPVTPEEHVETFEKSGKNFSGTPGARLRRREPKEETFYTQNERASPTTPITPIYINKI